MKRCPRCRRRHGESYSYCSPCRAYLRDWRRRKVAERRAAAVCPGCGSKRDGYIFCAACRLEVTERKARWRQEGRCQNCGKPRGERSDRLCDLCSDSRNARGRRQLLNPVRYASHRAACAKWRNRANGGSDGVTPAGSTCYDSRA